MHHHTHQAPPSDPEPHLLIAEGAVLPLQGTLDPMVWGQQAMMGLGCSMLLGSRPVLLQDWLPGLDVLCHGIALPADAQTSFDGQETNGLNCTRASVGGWFCHPVPRPGYTT